MRRREGGEGKTGEVQDCFGGGGGKSEKSYLLAEPFRRMSTALLSPAQKKKEQ